MSQAVVDLREINDEKASRARLAAARFAEANARDLVVFVCADLCLQAVTVESRVAAVRAELDTAEAIENPPSVQSLSGSGMARSSFRLAVGLAVGLLAQAATAPPARADWRVGAFLGSASTAASSVRLVQPAAGVDLTCGPVTWRDESFAQPPYYGYRIGHDLPFAPRVSVEAEFIHVKMYADAGATVDVRGTEGGTAVQRTEPFERTIERFSISHGLNFVLANAVYRQPIGPAASDRLTLTARAGLGPTVPHGESTVRGESRDQYELGALGWQVSAGVEVRLAGRLHAHLDYKHTRTRQTIAVAGGTAEVLARTHHVVFGAGYAFD